MTQHTPDLSALAPEVAAPLPAIPEQFSREAQADFLDALAESGNVRAACGAAGVSRSTAYRMRRACGRFAGLWDAALLVARTQVEAVLAERAINGVEETIFYHGEAVATRTRYDGRLLLAHLARLDRLVQDGATRAVAQGFDDALDDLLDAPEMVVSYDSPIGDGPVGVGAGEKGRVGERETPGAGQAGL